VKHYAANNQEFKRMSVSSEVSERALQEIYLPAFEAAVREGDAWSVMASYNRINGIYGCEHRYLLTTKLRDEWGFRGFVCSDWFAVRPTSSAEACVQAGLGLEMPGGIMPGIPAPKLNPKRLAAAFNAGKFSQEELDCNLAGLLRVMILTGLLDDPKTLPVGSRNTPEHFAVARKIAEEGMVLLKNDGPLLPLDINTIKTIAVIGPNASRKIAFGGGSSMVRAAHEITPLQGIREKCKRKVKIVKDPAAADVAIVVVGLYHKTAKHWDMEGVDRYDLSIPPTQVQLIQQTAAANPKTIVVLVTGSPIEMGAWLDHVPAVVEMWYAGMEGGRALADILFGDVNPSGKLTMTFPKQLADCPAHQSERTFGGAEKVYYDEGVFVGYRWFDAREIEPLFPFGHGLSYTTFAYGDLQVSPALMSGEGLVNVSVDVTNTGTRAGAEVAQLYLQDVEASVERPPKELKGFQKLFLAPGETQTATFELMLRDLSFWDEGSSVWKAEPGTFHVLVGSSSRDIRVEAEFDYAG
jgi:beta-glucosidase